MWIDLKSKTDGSLLTVLFPPFDLRPPKKNILCTTATRLSASVSKSSAANGWALLCIAWGVQLDQKWIAWNVYVY